MAYQKLLERIKKRIKLKQLSRLGPPNWSRRRVLQGKWKGNKQISSCCETSSNGSMKNCSAGPPVKEDEEEFLCAASS